MRLGIKNRADVTTENDYGNGCFIMIHLGNLTKVEQFHSLHFIQSIRYHHTKRNIPDVTSWLGHNLFEICSF